MYMRFCYDLIKQQRVCLLYRKRCAVTLLSASGKAARPGAELKSLIPAANIATTGMAADKRGFPFSSKTRIITIRVFAISKFPIIETSKALFEQKVSDHYQTNGPQPYFD